MSATLVFVAVVGIAAADIPRSVTAPDTSVPGIVVPAELMDVRVISRQEPKYPALAKLAHQQGTVVIHAVINCKGEIENMQVLQSAGRMLDDSAVKAVRHWRYQPYIYQGKVTAVETTIRVTYSLKKN